MPSPPPIHIGDDAGSRTWGRVRTLGAVAALVLSAAAAVVLVAPAANADPSANDWYRLRMCESSNNYAINTGNGYYGAYQFDLSTWQSVGGSGYPNQASPAEQDYRALYLYRMRGWQPWTCAQIVGLTDDSDAGSGVVPPRGGGSTGGGGTGGGGTSGRPAWPGTYYVQGQTSADIATWQKQMAKRGADLDGTGQYGPKTAAVVHQVQVLNGIPQSGRIGPETWAAAWTGKYSSAPVVPAASHGASPVTLPYPAWPGTYYVQGQTSANIATWQKQMARRGASFEGTGQFGPETAAVVHRIQVLNGIPQSGRIGPETWAAAWTGKY